MTAPDTEVQEAPADLLAQLPVDLVLSGSLVALLGSDAGPGAVRAAVQDALAELAGSLGVPARPVVHVRAGTTSGDAAEGDGAEGDEAPSVPPVRIALAVDGVECRYPAALPIQIAALRDARLPTIAWSPQDESWWATTSLEQQAQFVGTLCAEAVKLQPQVLLGTGPAESYRQVVADLRSSTQPHWCRTDRLVPILTGVLSMGMSIGDVETVAELLHDYADLSVDHARESLAARLSADKIEVFAPRHVASAMGTGDVADPDDLVAFASVSLFDETGVVFPPIVVRSPDGWPDDRCAVRINDLTSLAVVLVGDHECLVNDTPENLASLVPGGRQVAVHGAGYPGAIVPLSARQTLTDGGWSTWATVDQALLVLAQDMRCNVHRVVHQDRVQAQLETLEDGFAAVVRAARDQLPLPRLTAILRRLAVDRVSLRNLPAVLERVVDIPVRGSGWRQFVMLDDPVESPRELLPNRVEFDEVESFIRIGLRDYIADRAAGSAGGTVVCYLLGQNLEQAVCSPARGVADDDRILAAFHTELGLLPSTARLPVILTSAEVRPVLAELLRIPLPRLMVLAHGELPAALAVQPISRISLPD